MNVTVVGRLPTAFGMSRKVLLAAARHFAERSCGRVGGRWHEVAVHLVDDKISDSLHRAIMGIEGATDVITQAYDAIPPEEPGLFGEIFVNVRYAIRVAPVKKGWTAAKELLLYIAHGMDHLSGADDHAEDDRRRMRRRELGWLKEIAE